MCHPFFSKSVLHVRRFTTSFLLSMALLSVTSTLYAAPLTLESALQIAEENNTELKLAISNRKAIQGQLDEANAPLYNNPVINFEARRRSIYQPGRSDAERGEWGAGVSQTFEIAGQQGFRRETVESRLASLEQDIAETRRSVRAQVEEQFVEVLAIQERIEAEQRILALIEHNTELSRKRVAAGEDSKLDGNLAVVDAERARNQLSVLQDQLTRARHDLSTVLQLPEQTLPQVNGGLAPAARTYTLTDLLASVESRPAVKALSLRENSARSSLALERSQRYPDLTISLNNSREASVVGDDNITALGFTLPIPLFRRNAAGIGQAATELAKVEIDRFAFTRNAKTAVQAAWQRSQNIEARVQRLNSEVSPKLEENLRLSQLAFQNGEIGLPQLLIVQRQTIDAQRDLVEALRDLRLTQIELEYTAGWTDRNSSVHQE